MSWWVCVSQSSPLEIQDSVAITGQFLLPFPYAQEMGLPSAVLGAKSKGRMHIPRTTQGGGLRFPASQWESTDQATLTFSGGPAPWGQFCCLHETGENQTETEPNGP